MWPTGNETCALIRQETDTALLAFSAGKDSLAAWLVMRRHFPRIIPYYKYLVPDLEFVEESLAYYEGFFHTKIVRVPHSSLYRMLNNFVFQPPERCRVIEKLGLPEYDHDDIRDDMAEDFDLPPQHWNAIGTRACDNPQRRMAFTKHGPIRKHLGNFFPVWDMNKATLVELLHREKVKLPPEYRVFGRSFDGLDFRFLYGIKQHWPRDYQRILAWFPLADLEIYRYEQAQRHR